MDQLFEPGLKYPICEGPKPLLSLGTEGRVVWASWNLVHHLSKRIDRTDGGVWDDQNGDMKGSLG